MAGISSDVIRGYVDTMILSLLRQEPSYGYEISRRIREVSGGQYVIKETTLYSAFNRMGREGFIEAFPGSSQSGKRRTYYRITPMGIQHYQEKCDEWELTKDVVNRFTEGAGA